MVIQERIPSNEKSQVRLQGLNKVYEPSKIAIASLKEVGYTFFPHCTRESGADL
jgi:hypothetical protein